MNEQDKPTPGPRRIELSKGERIPKVHPDSYVEWPAGRPPGGKPIDPPGTNQKPESKEQPPTPQQ